MKICIPAKGETPNAQIDSTFGRCQYLLFTDTENSTTYQHENTYREDNSGVGTQVAQAVLAEGAEAVLSREIGPKAQEVLKAGNISAYRVDDMDIRDAVEKFKNNELDPLY